MTPEELTVAYNRARAARDLGASISLTGDEMLTLLGTIDMLQVELQEAREANNALRPDDNAKVDEYNTTLADAWDEGHHVGMQACVFNLATGRMNDKPNPYRAEEA